MPKQHTNYKQKFLKKWLHHESLKDWILEVPDDISKALCRYCRCSLKSKLCDLVDHSKTKKHQLAAEPFYSKRQKKWDCDLDFTTEDVIIPPISEIWGEAVILYFLELLSEYKKTFADEKKINFVRVEKQMKAAGYDLPAKELQKKWTSLLRKYRAVKLKIEDGGDMINWPYFMIMQDLLDKSDVMNIESKLADGSSYMNLEENETPQSSASNLNLSISDPVSLGSSPNFSIGSKIAEGPLFVLSTVQDYMKGSKDQGKKHPESCTSCHKSSEVAIVRELQSINHNLVNLNTNIAKLSDSMENFPGMANSLELILKSLVNKNLPFT